MGRSKASEATGDTLFKVRSSPVRHINKQTIGADSSNVIGEAITNPAYREAASDEYLGILILAALVHNKYSAPMGTEVGTAGVEAHQIQYGDQTSSPAIMDADNQFLHAHGEMQIVAATGVGFQIIKDRWPIEIVKMHPDDVIVTPEFTIVHDMMVNHAAYQSKEIQTTLIYQIVEVPDKVFTRMLMDQTRTS